MQNLVTKTEDEIIQDAHEIIERYNPSIMYLKNNGDEDYKWNVNDLNKWIDY